MDNNFLNQSIQQRGRQLRGIGILPDEINPFPGITLCLLHRVEFHRQSVDLLCQLALLCLVLGGEHTEILLRNASSCPVLIELCKQSVNLGLPLCGLFQFRSLLLLGGIPFPVPGAQKLVQEPVLILNGPCRPVLDSRQHIHIERIIADIVRGAAPSLIVAVFAALVVGIRISGTALDTIAHRPATISTLQKASENL